MAIVFDEVIADVSTPLREVTAEAPSADQSDRSQHLVRDVLKTIERNKYRELRIKED